MRKRLFNSAVLICCLIFASCSFFSSVEESFSEKDYNSEITNVTFSVNTLTVNTGESEMLKLTLSPSSNQGKCNVFWEYDDAFISAKTDNFGAIITGKKGGTTYIKAKCNGIVATCLISVISSGDEASENPYIYSNYSVIQLMPNNTMVVTASLYGGSIADMEDFTWEIKDSSIASIAPSRNNCIIEAHKLGSTQLVARHPNAEYDYSFVVYVYTDKLTETYITTDYNVMTINKNDTASKMLAVDLVNPVNAAYKNGFSWHFADEASKEIIQLNANLNTAEVIPLKNGIANIVVKHENSQYDLNIIVRVSTIVKNTYVSFNQSTVVLIGSDTPATVNAGLENYDGFVDPEKFVWDIPTEASVLAECIPIGNTIRIQGKKNGTFKVKVSHELSEFSRTLLVILQNQIGSAIDSSMYITTDQNYIQTQIGKEPVTVNVRLIGGIAGEDDVGENTFSWYIKNGIDNGIVEVQEVTGYVKDLNARSAVSSGEFCPAKLVIKPLKEGELTIVVTHPRCLYDTEIKVKVYSESALINPKTISTQDSLIRLLNGQSKEITATLRNKDEGDENKISWSSDDTSKVTVSPATGQTTLVTACGSGSSQSYISAHLDGALSDKKILVLQAATEDDLNSMKGIFADSTYLRIASDEVKEISVEQFGLSSSDRVTWTSSKSNICIVNGDCSTPYCTTAKVTGISEGTAVITAYVGGSSAPVEFNVTVLKKGESSEIYDENAGYMTTNLNAVVIEKEGDSASLSVSGVNISAADMSLYTTWSMTDAEGVSGESVFSLYGSPGPSVQLTANKPGKSSIKVSNKMSMNSLSINAKCGELYEWNDDYIVYITAENDVVNMMNGESKTIGCSLVNTTQTGSFSWSVTEGSDKIEITGLTSGTCNIKALQPGQAIITVSNSLAGEVTKEILVNVANSEEELKGFKYLTTTQNVVSVGESGNITVNVEIKNADSNIISGYSWRSSNNNIATVSGSGNIAVVYGVKEGSAKIIVENYEYCSYPLEIIVNVVDPIAAKQDPYISCNNIVTCTVDGDLATVVAELVGGSESDATGFGWAVTDSSIARLNYSNNEAQIKALKEGVTQVIVTHPRASVSRSILVICEPKVVTNCYITVTESIIKMSPQDESKTINATLVNGDANDIYDFKWWADSYDKINMNYTGSSCLIEPISSGTVTLHCSHPKAAAPKDIVLYISNYTDFAFASNSIEIETGKDTFINMEVPATGVDCEVSYKSSDNSLCTAFGNSSVCTLHPGTLPQGYDSYTCTVTAILQTKGGVKQAEAQLLVSVKKKDETKPYIGLYPDNTSTIITMNKGEKRNISAKLYGNTVDTTSAGLNWSINEGSGKFIEFRPSTKNYGSDVQIEALNSGKTTITVTHEKENGVPINPLTLYVIVTGVGEPTVTLNYQTLPVVIGEDTQTIVATVQNDTGEELEWKVVNDSDPDTEQDFFTFSSKGNKASVYAQKPGTATVYCTIPSTGNTASCKVVITEAPKMNFFVYDDESNFTYENGILVDNRNKYYLSSFQLLPGETKPIHWETVPPEDKITEWFRGDNSYFDINNVAAGYLRTWEDPVTKKVYHYPENVGTIAVSGKTTEGTAILRAKTASMQEDSVSISNTYGYLLTLNKTIVSSTPKEVHNKKDILYVDYELRPACSKLVITNTTEGSIGLALNLKNGRKEGENWIVDTHQNTLDTNSTGIVRGTLEFEVNGEVNCNVNIKAINENVVSSNNEVSHAQEFGWQNLKIKVYYPRHTFKTQIKMQVPNVNHAVYADNEKYSKYSYYDEATNTIFLGDGEFLNGIVCVDEDAEPYSNVNINKVSFEADKSGASQLLDGLGKKQVDRVHGEAAGSSYNSHGFTLYHDHEYSVYQYRTSKNGGWIKTYDNVSTTDGTANMYKLLLESDKAIEVRNETIKETSYVGNLVIEYSDYAAGSGYATYKIPVYVQVRNCPCADSGDYYQAYAQ